MPNAFVVGGRGQSGIAICRRLVAGGWSVTATTAGDEPDAAVAPGVRWVAFQREPDSLASVVPEGTDVLVHVMAFRSEHARELVALGERIGGAVVLTTLSVYSDDAGRSLDAAEEEADFPDWPVPIPESQPTLPPADEGYSRGKVAVEQVLREEAPWPVTIVRPAAIHGPYGRHLREWYFLKRILDGRRQVVLPYEGAHVFHPTATVNLGELVALAAEQRAAGTFNCADPDPPTPAEISETVDRLMGWRTERVLVEGPPPAPTVGNHPWAVPRPVVADMRAAETELGYRPVASYEEALRTTLPWAVAAAERRDWREVFPTLAGYSPELFDYAAEDEFLSRA